MTTRLEMVYDHQLLHIGIFRIISIIIYPNIASKIPVINHNHVERPHQTNENINSPSREPRPRPPLAAAALIITDAHDPSARFGSLSPSKTLWAHGE